MSPLHHPITQEKRVSQESLSAPDVDEKNVAAYLDGDGKNASHALEDDRAQGGDSDAFKGGLESWKESGALTEIVRGLLLLGLKHGNLDGSQKTNMETMLQMCAKIEGVDVSSYYYANATEYRGPLLPAQQVKEVFARWQRDCVEPYLAGIEAAWEAKVAVAEAKAEAARKEREAAEMDANATTLELAIVKLQIRLAEEKSI